MPFVNVKTSVKVEDAKKDVLEKRITKAITTLPGKSESHLMCAVEDGVSMMFHGDKAPTAFVEVKILGKSTRAAYEELTAKLCDILDEEIGVSPEYCYVKFEEIENWGFNGFLF